MKTKQVLAVLCASLLAAPALAGINPADPGLPTADTSNNNGASTYTGFTATNNQASAMCVDCHTVQPKAGGSHFVNPTSTGGLTNSGGSGIDNTGAIAARDNGAYFKISLWSTNGSTGAATYSKYADTSVPASYVPDNTVAGVTTATLQATASNYAGYDIVCESCHNIVINDAGGNNLLEAQANNEWEDTPVADLCVGCHGFMYTAAVDQSASGLANWGDARNTNEVSGGRKGNNEYHWVKGVARPQNHHVMTGDVIDATQAGLMVLWTDNDVVSYTDSPISNTSTQGTYPQKATWDNGLTKPSGGGLTCTNCHAPAHGQGASPAASILRNATYTAAPTALGPISRISDRGGWKKIDDLTYCGQCHQ
ncbi:hypothetical protein [Deferrisoma palaeochoriense]